MFNGHVDTVAAVNLETWQHDPWCGRAENDTVFGLGATDMKGAIAASVIAVRALVSTGVPLRGNVILQCAIGEESSEYEIGTRACVEEGFTGDAGICMEPTRQFVNDQLTLALAPVSLGTLVMRLTVKGLTVHAGRRREVLYPTGAPRPGVSAFEKGLLLVLALARLENNWVFTKRSPFYPRRQFVLNPGVVRAEPHGTGSAFFVPTRSPLSTSSTILRGGSRGGARGNSELPESYKRAGRVAGRAATADRVVTVLSTVNIGN